MKEKALALSALCVASVFTLSTCCSFSGVKPKVKGEPEVTRIKFERPPSVYKTVKVAVIDTGLDVEKFKNKITLCPEGHKDFTGTGIKDTHGHGTHISGLIEQYAAKSSYCQIIIKYYDPRAPGEFNVINTVKAFELAVELGADVINYSGGGLDPSLKEKEIILKALSKGIKVVVAAGNEHTNMDSGHKYYPAAYDDRIIVVGNLTKDRVPAESSNSGSIVTKWEIGTDVLSYCKDSVADDVRCFMSGTSQATAIHSGKVTKELDETYKNVDIDKVLSLASIA